MHQSSFDTMMAFRQRYLETQRHEPLVILDLGSQDINGSYHPIFALPPWRYVGIDVAPGPNVDLVLSDPYDWHEIEPESADVILAGQTFEHTEFFWETMRQIARTLKPDGICCIIVPSSGPEHRFPVDCWRMYPDGLRALARYAGLEILEARTQWEDLPQYDEESNKWHDSVLVAQKCGPSARSNA
jgi:SAM-dependent methyltransferase